MTGLAGSSGDMSARTINQLVMWMIEHPCIDAADPSERTFWAGGSSESEARIPMPHYAAEAPISLRSFEAESADPSGPVMFTPWPASRPGHMRDQDSAFYLRGLGPRRRASSDIRSYMAERSGTLLVSCILFKYKLKILYIRRNSEFSVYRIKKSCFLIYN